MGRFTQCPHCKQDTIYQDDTSFKSFFRYGEEGGFFELLIKVFFYGFIIATAFTAIYCFTYKIAVEALYNDSNVMKACHTLIQNENEKGK